jgi:hypothetical protein
MKRKAGLCGTSNESDILKDVTGNRRILPLNVISIDYDAMIKINTDDLWREAYDLWRKDFDWKIYNAKDVDYLAQNTCFNLEVMPVEEIFFSIYSLEQNENFPNEVIVNQGQILQRLNAVTSFNISKYEVKDILIKNKIDYKPYKRNGQLIRGCKFYVESEIVSDNPQDIPF